MTKETTTIQVSKDNRDELVLIKVSCKAKDLDEVIGRAIILLKKELKK